MTVIFDPESDLMNAMSIAKPLIKTLSCPIHGRKAGVCFDYDDRGTNAYITKYCCPDFAEYVIKKLEETQRFDNIEIKNVDSVV